MSMRSWFRFVVAAFTGGSLLAAPLIGSAQSSIFAPRVIYSPTGGSVVLPAISKVSPAEFGRVWGPVFSGPTPTGGVLVRDAVKATVGTAVDVAMEGARSITPANVAKVLARGIGLGFAITAGAALFDAASRIRCRKGPSAGSLECDFGEPLTTQSLYSAQVRSGGPFGYGSTLAAAVTDSAGKSAQTKTVNASGATGTETTSYRLGTCNAGGTSCTSEFRRVESYPTRPDFNADTGWLTNFSHSGGPQNVQACASGSALSPVDGKCVRGVYTPTDENTVAARDNEFGDKGAAVPKVQDAVNRGLDVTPFAEPTALTGPASATGPATTTTNTPPGGGSPQTTTTSPVYNITYQGDSYAYNTSTTTTNPDGSTTTTNAPAVEVETCGLPGKPACKIDESGTPTWTDKPSPVDQLTGLDAAKRAEVEAQVQAPTFGFIGAPPLVACTPIEYPYSMGSLDPCGVVDGVRGIMAYIWAIAAAWLSLGWIREAVQGG